MKKKEVVFVGLSGGVDSAVSAALLKASLPAGRQGYDVVGVFIKTWHPDFLECNEEEERHDAMRVAAHLDIPFLTFDFQDVYKKEVADYMIAEYKMGRTPNPDVMCNKEVKFGAFLKKAISMGADYVATGHYARTKVKNAFEKERLSEARDRATEQKHSLLLCGQDPTKDQSYFLWTLKQDQLSKILFPIGHLKKTEVRKLAKKLQLPVAEKKDSQGICFLGDIDLKEFLKHYIKEKIGKVLDTVGEEIGYHDGAVFHTLGERHGFTITKKSPTGGAYYIVSKDVKKNILVVSQNPVNFLPLLQPSAGTFRLQNSQDFTLQIQDCNWISDVPISHKLQAKSYSCQIRYHGEFLSCKVESLKSNRAQIIFTEPVLVASGQSCVVYDGDICLGGGVVI